MGKHESGSLWYKKDSDGQCHVYAAPIVKGLYTPLKTEHNTTYHEPNPGNISVGINSKYIKVEAISCFGCKNIRNIKCFGQAKQGTFEE